MNMSLDDKILEYYLQEGGRFNFNENKDFIARFLKISIRKLERIHNQLATEGHLKRINTRPAQWILSEKGREVLFEGEEEIVSDDSAFNKEKEILDELNSFYGEKESEDTWYFFNKDLLEFELKNLKVSPHKLAEFYRNYTSDILGLLLSIAKYGRDENFSNSIFKEIRRIIPDLAQMENTDLWNIENHPVYISISSMAAEPKFFIGFEQHIIDRYIQEGIELYLLIFLGSPNIYLLLPPSKLKEIFTEDTVSFIQQGERIRKRYLLNFFITKEAVELRLRGGISDNIIEYLNNPLIEQLRGLTTFESEEAQSILYIAINLNKLSHLRWWISSEEVKKLEESHLQVQTSVASIKEKSIERIVEEIDTPISYDDTDIGVVPEPDAFLDMREINLQIPESLESRLETIRKKVAIEKEILLNIVTELILNKNIILYGPPGCGKTALAILLSRIFFDETDELSSTEKYGDIVTATADWTTNDVIGGLKKVKNEFQSYDGYVTRAVRRCRELNRRKKGYWLVIDEFNRADIDKAFGSMFTAIEYQEIIHPFGNIDKDIGTDEEIVKIPSNFRLICTMNSFDKGHLFPLSYGLLRRFALIEIPVPPIEDEKRIVIKNAKEITRSLEIENEINIEEVYTKLLDIFSRIRSEEIDLQIGTSHMISTINHSLGKFALKRTWSDDYLEDGLTIHVLPQIEGLSDDLLEKVQNIFRESNMNNIVRKIDEFRKFRIII